MSELFAGIAGGHKNADNSFFVPSGFSLAQRQKTEFVFLRNDSISLGGHQRWRA